VRRTTWNGACYLVCWASTPYQAGRNPCHYLGHAFPDDEPAKADARILTEIAQAAHTRLTRRRLTRYMAAGVALRIAAHRAGHGARLTSVVTQAGIEFRVTRIWVSATRGHEAALKDLNNRSRLCPSCNPGTTAGTIIIPKRFRRPARRRVTLETAA
jgi:hypothetical protein